MAECTYVAYYWLPMTTPRSNRRRKGTRPSAELQAHQARCKAKLASIEQAIRDRLNECLAEDKRSTNRLAIDVGMGRTAIRSYRGVLRSGGRRRKPSVPGLGTGRLLADELGGVSLDWLAGHNDVPKYRRERTEEGDLATRFRELVVRYFVDQIPDLEPPFIDAVAENGEQLMAHALESLLDRFAEPIRRIARRRTDADESPDSVSAELGRLRKERFRASTDAAQLRRLPHPYPVPSLPD